MRSYRPRTRKTIKGHARQSTAKRVAFEVGLPVGLFHALHDRWKAHPEVYPFSRYLVALIEKGLLAK